MVPFREYIELFESFSPGFKNEWDGDDLWNSGVDTSIHSLLSFYSNFVAEILNDPSLVNRVLLFSYIESVMSSGDKHARDAAATCFLENLLHVVGNKFHKDSFFPFLGAESLSFLREWDSFNKVKTDGVW